MPAQPDFDIVTIGHFARDRLVVDGHGEMVSGGGVYYGSVALRRLGLRVAVATCLAGTVTALKQEQPGPWHGSLAEAEALAS